MSKLLHQSQHTQLQDIFASHYNGTLNMEQLLPKVTQVQVSVNGLLWQAQQSQQYLYVLKKGLLFAFFDTCDGKSVCKEVYWENDLLFGFRSLLSALPYPFSVKAVEESQLYRIPKDFYLSLVAENQDWRDFHLSIVSEYYMYKEGKEEFLLLNTPEQRVALFYKTYPDLVLRLPQHVIASYLGMTPISFSRIKKRLGLLTNVNANPEALI